MPCTWRPMMERRRAAVARFCHPTRLRARLRVPLIIQASRSPGAKVRASSGVGFSNHSSQAVRRRAARRQAARRRAVRRRGARWPCLRLPPRAAHSRPPPPRVRRPSPALPTGSWLQRRAALQRRRHRLRQASRKLHQLRRHPTLLGFRTISSRGTERVSAARAPWSPSRRGKACMPSGVYTTRLPCMFVSTTHSDGDTKSAGTCYFSVSHASRRTEHGSHGPAVRIL